MKAEACRIALVSIWVLCIRNIVMCVAKYCRNSLPLKDSRPLRQAISRPQNRGSSSRYFIQICRNFSNADAGSSISRVELRLLKFVSSRQGAMRINHST